ncbi:MAG: PDZ domain-containing protein [Planctomycetaceae bacterium]|nr:PDZ domain-containing protein [Planctomycetaceae bacterium]
MKSFIFFILICLCFAADMQAMTLHILWITAANDSELKLDKAAIPSFTVDYDMESGTQFAAVEELGHTVKHYHFGKGNKDAPLESKAILRSISAMQIAPDDAVMVYYRGHGAFDERQQCQYYLFTNDDGKSDDILLHSDMRLAVEKLRPRLSIFFRDCCNVFLPLPTRGVQDGVMSEAPEEPARKLPPKLFVSLFVHSRGVIDIGSAKKGLAALAQDFPAMVAENFSDLREPVDREYFDYQLDCGTVFSNSLKKIVTSNYGSALTWQQFLGLLTRDTENRFRKMHPSAAVLKACVKHTPHCYVLGGIYAYPQFDELLKNSDIPSGYFEFEGEPAYGGVRMTRVKEGSRGQKYGLEVNDIIYAVDDVVVTTNTELDLAVRALGADGKLKFTLIDCRITDEKSPERIKDFSFPDIRAPLRD